MIHDIRLHGQVGKAIEFYATIAGKNINHRYFYETSIEKEKELDRFFSPGNEFIINDEGVNFNSNGGSFCEYMFGVEQPFKDLVKKDVLNRLAIFGTFYDEEKDKLAFTSQTSGSDSFDKIFFNMHAVSNYYFFIHYDMEGDVEKKQESILKTIGKNLKRNPSIGHGNDTVVAHEILKDVNMPDAILFLFKLINLPNLEFYETFKTFYHEKKEITEEEKEVLRELAEKHGIDQYQQERIKIDVMYKDAANKRIIDEYKDILIETEKDVSGEKEALASPKLTRLRTFSVRNNIPMNLFDTLDNMILKGKKIVTTDEPEYIVETREILEGLFLLDHGGNSELINDEDLMKLLRGKKTAVEKRDRTFEGILLDTGRICDEIMKEEKDTTAFENFGYIVTFFDRYDATSAVINQLAFMEKVNINEDQVRSLIGNKKVFDDLKDDFFRELFFDPILANSYLTYFGRKKISVLLTGLEGVAKGDATLHAVVEGLYSISREEAMYNLVHRKIKERIKTFYSELNTKEEQDILKREINKDLRGRGEIEKDIPDEIFSNAIMNIKKEAVYLHNLLPEIIKSKDSALREDFLANSGLDRFYIEELEREYFQVNQLGEKELQKIRKIAA